MEMEEYTYYYPNGAIYYTDDFGEHHFTCQAELDAYKTQRDGVEPTDEFIN